MNANATIDWKIEESPEALSITFTGDINEAAEGRLSKLLDQKHSNIIFDLSGIASVDSCGVRCWIQFVASMEEKGALTFTGCTPEIIHQVNMIPNFKGSATIQSLFGEYTCPSCEHKELRRFEKGKNMPESLDDTIEPLKCSKCGDEMEMEELEEEFFGWLQSS